MFLNFRLEMVTTKNMKNMFKTGFATGLGVLSAFIPIMFFALIFFVPGLYLYGQEKRKPQGQRNNVMYIVGLVLIAIGVIIMGGGGFGFLAEGVMDY
jgi:hypothetical protein